MEITRRTLLQAGALLAAAPAARPAPSDRITVGVVGTGARGQELMQAIQQHPQAEMVGLVDAYKGRLDRALSRTQGRAKIYPTHRELLAEKSIDAVVVAIPDHLHKAVVVDCLRAGKDVYCEKPLTYVPADGLEIKAAVASTRRIMQVGSQGISSGTQRRAKQMIQSGRLGRITMVRAAYNRNTASGAWIYPIPPDASPETVNWAMFQGSAQGSAAPRPISMERFFRWRCYQEYSGGIATDLFVHLCTTIHFLLDAKMPARAMAMGELYRWKESRDVPDTLNAILEYPEGFTVNLSSSFNNEMSSEAAFQILGTEGSITLGFEGMSFFPENAVEDNRWIVDSWAQPLEDAYYRDPKVIATEVEPAKRPQKQPEHFKDEGPEATVAHFGHFFESVRSRQPYWENEVAGHHAAACAHMINLSAQQRRQVTWDFAKDLIAVPVS